MAGQAFRRPSLGLLSYMAAVAVAGGQTELLLGLAGLALVLALALRLVPRGARTEAVGAVGAVTQPASMIDLLEALAVLVSRSLPTSPAQSRRPAGP